MIDERNQLTTDAFKGMKNLRQCEFMTAGLPRIKEAGVSKGQNLFFKVFFLGAFALLNSYVEVRLPELAIRRSSYRHSPMWLFR